MSEQRRASGRATLSSEQRAEYLARAISEADGDPRRVLVALGEIVRAVGISEIAKRVGMSRQGLHTCLSETGNPKWETVWRITAELGLEVRFQAWPQPE